MGFIMEQNLSTTALLKASIIALLLSCLTFICIVLPAEFNIDPTGLGKTLGLTEIAQVEEKVTLKFDGEDSTLRSDDTEIIVRAGKGLEYKLHMKKHSKVKYEWLSDGAAIYLDLHGEPYGDTTGYFESYVIATSEEMKGSFTVPFDGTHGWYFKNTSDKDITILLQTEGQYRLEP